MAKRGKKGRAAGKAFAVAFLVTLAVLLVGGFGTGTLTLSGPSSPATLGCSSQTNPCYYNNTGSGSPLVTDPNSLRALEFGVALPPATLGTGTGPPIITSFNGAGATTSVTFGFLVTDRGNWCNGSSPIVYNGGGPQSELWYSVSFYPAGSTSPADSTFVIDGSDYTGTSVAPAVLSGNGTQSGSTGKHPFTFAECQVPPEGSFNTPLSGLSAFPTVSVVETAGGTGVLGYLAITFHASGSACIDSGSGPTTEPCSVVFGTSGSNSYYWHVGVTALIPVVPGGATVSPPSCAPCYNGGQVSLSVTTGYAGPQGWTLQVNLPSARQSTCGAAIGAPPASCNAAWADTTGQSSPVSVANDLFTGAAFTFNIPANAAQNSTTSNWNAFTVTLYSSFYQQSATVGIDTSPGAASGATNISFFINGNQVQQGSATPNGGSLTVSLVSYSPINPVASFVVDAFYYSSVAGQSPQTGSQPACSSGLWVTPCGGVTIPAFSQGKGSYTATYSGTGTGGVQLSFPPNAQEFGVWVVSQTSTANTGPPSWGGLQEKSTCFNACGGGFSFAELIPYLTATLITTGIGAVVLLAFGSGLAAWSTIAVVGVASFSAAAFGAFDGLVVAGSTVMRTAGEIKLRSILEALTAGG